MRKPPPQTPHARSGRTQPRASTGQAAGTKSTIERAFELAQSGEYGSITDVKKRLREEGFDLQQLEGSPSLSRQLRNLCAEASRRAHPDQPRSRSPSQE